MLDLNHWCSDKSIPICPFVKKAIQVPIDESA